MKLIVVFFVALASGVGTRAEDEGTAVVRAHQGRVSGVQTLARSGRTLYSFRSVPYARPPLGDLRFQAPRSPEKWEGVYDATSYGHQCLHYDESLQEVRGHEDCLHLHIQTPSINPIEALPVIVFFHGESYKEGREPAPYGNELIAEKNVIYVFVNFRMSILGLLSLGTEHVPGNAMFKDQTQALHWISKNIKVFGGDPKNVNIMGYGSGATSVFLHTISPLSKGLFKRAISLSGANLCEWLPEVDMATTVRKYHEYLGRESNTTDDILKDLRELPADQIVRSFGRYAASLRATGSSILGAVLESESNGAFLTMTPSAAYKHRAFNDVPMMISHASKEFGYFADSIPELRQRPGNFLRKHWNLDPNSALFRGAVKKVMDFYLRGKPLNSTVMDDFEYQVDLFGDIHYAVPADETVRTLVQYARSPIYYYRFSYRGGMNSPVVNRIGMQGATHLDDFLYLTPHAGEKDVKYRSSDDYIRKRIVKLITDFVKYGDPTPFDETHMIPTKWLPASKNELSYLEFSGELAMSWDPDAYRTEFWRDLENYLVKKGGCPDSWRDTCSMNC